MSNGKQVSKPKQEEMVYPPAPVEKTAAVVQMTASQLSASLSKAKTEGDINRALENAMNYINSIDSSKMSDKDYKANRVLLEQIVAARDSMAQQELQPKLAEECIERMIRVLEEKKAPTTAQPKIDIPLKYKAFGFFGAQQAGKQGGAQFGNLPSEQAAYIPESSQGEALEELNKLATTYLSGGDTSKAGKNYLKFIEGLANDRWGNNTTAKEAMICNLISAGPGAGCDQAKQMLKSGNYWNLFGDSANPMGEWRRAGSSSSLTLRSETLEIMASAEIRKRIFSGEGKNWELGLGGGATAYKKTETSVDITGGQYGATKDKTTYAAGGTGFVYGEANAGRFKLGGNVGVEYNPLGWIIPVEAFGEVTMGSDGTSQILRMQIKASPEVTGKALGLEAGLLWNSLYFQKGDSAVGLIVGVRGARMSVEADGTTWVTLTIEGQIGPQFQQMFRNKDLAFWVGAVVIPQVEFPQGRSAMGGGELPAVPKLGAGVQVGLSGKAASGFLEVGLTPQLIRETELFTGPASPGIVGVPINLKLGVSF